MKLSKFAGTLAAATLVTSALTGLSVGTAQAATAGTVFIVVNGGSHHEYNGTYDSCTGNFTASGTIAEGYTEQVTGNLSKTGALTFTSTYGNGPVNDQTGLYSAYGFTATAQVESFWFNGTAVITKTSLATGVTSSLETIALSSANTAIAVTDGIGNCDTTAPPVITGTHGQYVSGAAKVLKGTALAAVAKNLALVGPYTG